MFDVEKDNKHYVILVEVLGLAVCALIVGLVAIGVWAIS